jgi:DNA-binding NarL/FixJ family response regulator
LPAACAKEIAHYLGIAEATANAHVKHILEKLQVSDRLTAVITAWREGIIRE